MVFSLFGDAISRFFSCILCGADPDLVFAYSTVRIVRIRDRRLGLLHYFFMIGVFLYIIIYTMLMQKSYLFIKEASGTIRLQLKRPGEGHTLPPEALPYCGNETFLNSKSQPLPQFDCVYLNEIEARYPGEELDALFLTTRIKYQEVYRPSGCSPPTSPRCSLRESEADASTYLVAQPEMYTLWMDHAMTPDGFGENAYSGQTRSTGFGLTGEITNRDGTEPTHNGPEVEVVNAPGGTPTGLTDILEEKGEPWTPGVALSGSRVGLKSTSVELGTANSDVASEGGPGSSAEKLLNEFSLVVRDSW
ncbi:hypothetical protein CYMTET_27164 [Cymbomonas tetramitiformis]|uniref:Uncharacterized protein n=1 Tax=Cymbomonas tetramitiformis TaxID=36881 RepID=A0AAE0FQB5_9CHLO|nr:hypothetical protein CYMTET_27164 [Cymbomonas tetramitiformis]